MMFACRKLPMSVQSQPAFTSLFLVPLKYLPFENLVKKKNKPHHFVILSANLLSAGDLFILSIHPGIIPNDYGDVPASHLFWACPSPGKWLWFHPGKNFAHSPYGLWFFSGSSVTLETAPRRVCFHAFRAAAAGDLAHIGFSAGRKVYPLPLHVWCYFVGAWRKKLWCSWSHLMVNQWEGPLSSDSGYSGSI